MWWNDRDTISFANRDVRKITEVADTFITESPDPFFLTVAYPDAHLPFLRQQCGIPEIPYEADDVAVLPQVGIDTQRLRQHAADYYNCMSRLDTAVGFLLDRLNQSGKSSKTLVIFTTDHGAQFSRGKTCCYEGGLRVPYIVRVPGVTKSGAARSELVSHVDILPSITDFLGLETPKVAGRSQLALWEGGTVAWRDYVCAEWTGANPPVYFPQRSIRSERYKLIVNYLSDRPNPSAIGYSGPNQLWEPGATVEEILACDDRVRNAYARYLDPPPEELFDLEKDPWEYDNLIDDVTLNDVKTDLRSKLAEWQSETDDRIADPEILNRLTQEHDTISASQYGESAWGSRDFEWNYADYLFGHNEAGK